MDSKVQESRDAMRAERFSSSQDHFVAGVKSLGMGLVGGLTSLVTQPYQGAHNSGMSVSLSSWHGILPDYMTGSNLLARW